MSPQLPVAQADRDTELTLDEQLRMVQALRSRLAAEQGEQVQLIETHISFVLVCGGQAYKIKKALKNSFLDQSTLARRLHACHEELRLNGRLAARLYEGVVAVTGGVDEPALAGAGPAIDCAVQMRAFDQAGLWDRLAERHALGPAHVDELARVLAPFHAAAAAADPRGRLGSPAQVREPLRDSLDELDRLLQTPQDHECVRQLRAWEEQASHSLAPVMAERLANARVRECHGDLHLGNVTLIDGRTTVFDGIEFNDDFRWIDVMSDVAFMAMDLQARGLSGLAHRFVNAYLEAGGDYDGVRVLNYYLLHRALVRAKVDLLRLAQCQAAAPADAAGEAAQHAAAAAHYLELALQYCRPAQPVLMLTHGFSGSGKTTQTQGLLQACGAVRIRADVERKRLAGLQALDRSSSTLSGGLYSEAMTRSTYARLLELAAAVLAGGRHVILDATFLQRAQRDAARDWAATRRVPCLILDFDADAQVLRQRVRERAAGGVDASEADEAVLAAQMRTAEPLQADELGAVFRCPPQAGWAPLLERLAVP
jgi:aminoglycoside phosphotransferase family enzyme/predicted kinase